MAAITTTLLTLLEAEPGRERPHLLAQDCLYGGTLSFLTEDAPATGDRRRLRRRRRSGGVGGPGPAGYPRLPGGEPDESPSRGGRPGGGDGLLPGAGDRLRHRQHLRHAGQLPAPGGRLRRRAPQRNEVPQRPLRHRRRRPRLHGGAGPPGDAQDEPPRRRAGSPRLLPAAAGAEDPGPARGAAEPQRPLPGPAAGGPPLGGRRPLPGAGRPPGARAGAPVVRRQRAVCSASTSGAPGTPGG